MNTKHLYIYLKTNHCKHLEKPKKKYQSGTQPNNLPRLTALDCLTITIGKIIFN